MCVGEGTASLSLGLDTLWPPHPSETQRPAPSSPPGLVWPRFSPAFTRGHSLDGSGLARRTDQSRENKTKVDPYFWSILCVYFNKNFKATSDRPLKFETTHLSLLCLSIAPVASPLFPKLQWLPPTTESRSHPFT